MNNLFEKATRQKLRFATPVGALTTEQLWDLNLDKGQANLLLLATELQKEVSAQPAEELAFFKKAAAKNEVAELKFEIVKHIVTVKVAEMEDKETAAARKTQREELDALIAAKEQEAKSNMSLEDLKKMRAQLD